ncbi:AI-2E family transporter [uncultured Anaerofustis sp.]|uniref:AI-2E family transporter n=1 Tax=uncultured Anaerofustis sp. TaxID=904996 RepID=UPI0025EAF523|nr:AI-2E family transporter [uncultured Anaerofustis sp.]
MKQFKNIERKYIEYLVLITFAVCFIIAFYFGIQNLSSFSNKLVGIWNAFYVPLKPVLIGFIIAFFLYQPVDNLYNRISKHSKFKDGTNRVLSSVAVMIIAILIITLIVYIVLPSTITSITSLITSIQDNMGAIENFVTDLTKHPMVVNILNFFNIDITTSSGVNATLVNMLSFAKTWVEGIGTNLVNATMSVGKTVYNVFIAIFLALYMLIDKDTLLSQFSRVAEAIFSERIYGRVSYVLDLMNYMFFKFLSGKAICSLIVGAMGMALAYIFKIKYASLIAFIITITNMIPLFGPIFSVIPCSIFAMISGGPIQGIIMVLIIIFIQQIDQNVLAPKILGDVVGLNGFWVIVSIIFCGSLFGVVGMVIGIPIFAVLKILMGQWLMDRKDENKPPLLTSNK